MSGGYRGGVLEPKAGEPVRLTDGRRVGRPARAAVAVLVAGLWVASCAGGGSGAPTPAPTTASPVATTPPVATAPGSCGEVTGLFPVSAALDSWEGACRQWVERSIGRAILGSTGSASLWSRRTPLGTALIAGAIHTLGQGWFGPADTPVSENIIDPGAQTGILRLFLMLPDGSGPDALASPWFGLYNPAIAAERNSNLMKDVLPIEDFYVAVADSQKLDVAGLPPVPGPIVPGPVPVYDPFEVTLAASTFAEAPSGALVMLVGYPNAPRSASASIGRVLSDDEARSIVELLADLDDPEGTIAYDPEVEFLVEGAAVAGMSGGPVVDDQGRLVGVMVRATDVHDGRQYVRAVRMTYIAVQLDEAVRALPEALQEAMRDYLEE